MRTHLESWILNLNENARLLESANSYWVFHNLVMSTNNVANSQHHNQNTKPYRPHHWCHGHDHSVHVTTMSHEHSAVIKSGSNRTIRQWCVHNDVHVKRCVMSTLLLCFISKWLTFSWAQSADSFSARRRSWRLTTLQWSHLRRIYLKIATDKLTPMTDDWINSLFRGMFRSCSQKANSCPPHSQF